MLNPISLAFKKAKEEKSNIREKYSDGLLANFGTGNLKQVFFGTISICLWRPAGLLLTLSLLLAISQSKKK